jgi:hypothetical protein
VNASGAKRPRGMRGRVTAAHDEHRAQQPVLLVDEGRCGAAADRVLAHTSWSSYAGVLRAA